MGANEYDEAVDQLTPSTQTPAAANPYDATVEALGAQTTQKLRTTLTQARDTGPDKAAEAKTLGDQLGLPTDVVLRNFDAVKRRASLASTPYEQIIRETPTLGKWAAEPSNAAVAHDDMENLGALEWLVTAPSRAFAQGVNQFRYGSLRSQSLFRDLTRDEKDLLDAYKFHMDEGGALGTGNRSWFAGAVTGAARQIPNIFGAGLHGLKYGLAGAAEVGAAGALAGSVLPGAGTLAGGITGAGIGFRAGMLYGGWKATAQLEAGFAYDEYLQFKDEHGQPIDPQVAKAAALATGAINGGVELFALEKLVSSIPGIRSLGRAGTKAAIGSALRVPTVRAALFEAVKSYGSTLTTETATEVAQRAVTILSGELAKAAGQTGDVPGQVEKGNVNLFAQPRVSNADGSISTVDSVSVGIDGKEVLLPQVTPDGRHLKSPEEALAEYQQTGKHLGIFDSPASATAFASQLHEDYAAGKYDQKSKFRSAPSIVEDLVGEAAGAIQGFALTVLPGPALDVVIGTQRARRAEHTSTFFKALGEGVANSKTMERSPEAGQAFLAKAVEGGPLETVYAPIDTWNTYWQSKDLDPAEVAKAVTGNPRAYEQAMNEGGDLPIPMARYAAKLAATEHNAYFQNELRLGPDEMNQRESDAFAQQVKTTDTSEPTAENPAAPIRTAILAQLKGAGLPTATATAYAELYESAIGSLAERAGVDPAALYQSYGLTVQKEGQQAVAKPDTRRAAATATEAATVPVTGRGEPMAAAASSGPPAGVSERRQGGELPAGQAERRDQPINAMADLGAAAVQMIGEGIKAGTKGARAVFLAHGPDGPLYNIIGGPKDGSTVMAAGLKAEGIPVPETPAATGERKTGEQLRAEALAARAATAAKEQTLEAVPASESFETQLAAFGGSGHPESADYVTKVLAAAGEGDAGLSVEKVAGTSTADLTAQRIVYRGKDGTPIAVAKIVEDASGKLLVMDLAADKSKGLLTGRAMQAIGKKLIDLGATEAAGTVSPDAQNFIDRLKERAAVDNKTAEAETGEPDAAGSQEGGYADRLRSAAERGIPASYPREREKPQQREARRVKHYDAAFADLLDAARALDPNVDDAELRAEFDFRVNALESRLQDAATSGHDATDLLTAIAGYGGINTEESTFPGEVKFLKDGAKFGRVGGVSKVFQKSGLSIDGMIEALRQDQRFAWVENATMLIDAIDDAIRHPRADDYFPGNGELWKDANMNPTVAWWTDSWRPANLLADVDESDMLDTGAGDTSFNIAEFDQSLFDDISAPDQTADELTKQTAGTDRLDTGELQPRLPGAGQVREQEIATPQLEAPFSLTSEAVTTPKEKQTELFQREPLTPEAVKMWALDVKERAGNDLREFDVYLNNQGDLHLDLLVVERGAQRAGLGTKVMRELARYADTHGRRITLQLANKNDSFGTTSRSRLVKFYKGFGFVENKGRHQDFALSLFAHMYREPTSGADRETTLNQPEGPAKIETLPDGTSVIRVKQARGAIRFGPDRQFSIDLLQKADLSTFLHESGHFFLEVFGDLAQQATAGDTPQQTQLRADYETLLQHLGVERRDQIGTPQHEQFAREFEQYLFEGKAPSLELVPTFAKFRAWLVKVYRSLRGLNIELSEPVRRVFDRMVASDRAIADAEARRGLQPMFATAADAGMSEPEFALYRKTAEEANAVARAQLDRRLLSEIRREQTRAWKAEEAEIQAQVTDDVQQRPEYRALSAIQHGTHPNGQALIEGLEAQPLKLSRAMLIDQFGEDRLRRLPRNPYLYAVDGGLDPEVVARMFGYTSADAMLTALEQAPPIAAVIESTTKQKMIEAHGSLLLDGSIAEAAQTAVSSTEHELVLTAELRAIARKRREVDPFVKQERAAGRRTLEQEQAEREYERRWFEAEHKLALAIAVGRKQSEVDALDREVKELRRKARGAAAYIRGAVPSPDVLKQAAAERLAVMPIRDINPQRFWSASRRAGQQALERAARQDLDGAVVAKQQELINLHLYRAAEEQVADIDDRVQDALSLTSKARRQSILAGGENYLDQIDGLLDRFGFAAAAQKVLDRRPELRKFVEGVESTGQAIDLPDLVLDESRRSDYHELTVAEFNDVTDAIQSIAYLAREKDRLLKSADRAALNATAATIADSIRTHGTTRADLPARDRRASIERGRTIEDIFASHRKMANLARELDGFEDGGAFWTGIVQPLNEAGAREAEMNADAAHKFGALVEAAYPRGAKRELYHKVEIPAIGNSLSKMERIAVALNWGNEGNRDRIRRAERWTDEQVRAVLATLDARDATFVQGVLDLVNSYWPAIEEKQKRVYGYAPTKVEATPFVVAGQELAGGYYPLKYDDRMSAKVGAQLDLEASNLARQAAYAQATTKRGHTKDRLASVKLPVRLDFGVMFEHTKAVIHDLSHHEALIDVGRILGHPDVQSAIYDTHGDITYRQFKNGIRDVAFGDIPATNAFERALNHVRSGATIAGLGWSLTTALLQPIGLTQSAARIGPQWVGRGLIRWMRGAMQMENTAAWINEKSALMRTRQITQQREINEIRNTLGVGTGKFSGIVDDVLGKLTMDTVTKQGIADSYFYLITQMQRVADIPTWLGQYEKSMANGESEERAIAIADQAVLDAQGGGQNKDLAAVQRGGPLLKVWTNFYSFFNVTYNLSVDAVKRTNYKDPASVGRLGVDYLMLYLVPATLGYALREGLKGNVDPDDPESTIAGLIRENLSYMMGTVLGFREVAGAVQGYYGYEGPAGARGFAAAGKLMQQSIQAGKKIAEGDADEAFDAAFWKSLNSTAGILFHYPASQFQRTVQGVAAIAEGKSANPGVLIAGPPKDAK